MSEEVDASLIPALSTPVHILIVDDDRAVSEWIEKHLQPLREAFPRAQLQIVYDMASARTVVYTEKPPNVVLLDLLMPDSKIHESIREAKRMEGQTAVVIITGNKSRDVEELLVGSQIEVLQKDKSLFTNGNIIRAIVRALLRRDKADSDRVNEHNKQILRELEKRGYGPTPTQSA